MSYAIIRTKKLTTNGNIAASIAHNLRERECDNADPNLSHLNEYYNITSLEEINAMTDVFMLQKNNVKVFEVMLTASSDFFENSSKEKIKEWKKENIQYLEDEYGKNNVKNIAVHYDEQTMHIHAHILPIITQEVTQRRTNEQIKQGEVGNKKQVTMLSAKHYLGGKDKLRILQTNYANKMNKFGLERGIEGSKAKHDNIQAYYNRVNAPAQNLKLELKIDKPGVFGRDEYVEKTTQSVTEQVQDVVSTAQTQAQEAQRQKTLLEALNRSQAKIKEKYTKLEKEQAKLAQERANFAIEKQQSLANIEQAKKYDIKKEVDSALQTEKTAITQEKLVMQTEKKAIEATKQATETEYSQAVQKNLSPKDLEILNKIKVIAPEAITQAEYELKIDKSMAKMKEYNNTKPVKANEHRAINHFRALLQATNQCKERYNHTHDQKAINILRANKVPDNAIIRNMKDFSPHYPPSAQSNIKISDLFNNLSSPKQLDNGKMDISSRETLTELDKFLKYEM